MKRHTPKNKNTNKAKAIRGHAKKRVDKKENWLEEEGGQEPLGGPIPLSEEIIEAEEPVPA